MATVHHLCLFKKSWLQGGLNMFTQWKKIAATLGTAALLSMATQQALAQHNHHAHEEVVPEQLTLNNGKKWATDDSLRKGMTHIRDAVAAQLPSIHSDKATAKQYRTLAQKVNQQISFMVQNCKLDPEVDAKLHILLAEIIAGADAMQMKQISKARDGAVKIVIALDNYATYFDHPGWQGIMHGH